MNANKCMLQLQWPKSIVEFDNSTHGKKLSSCLDQGRAVDPRTPEHSGVEVSTPELFWGWILFWD